MHSIYVNSEKNFAFVEFRSIEECNAALAHLNGMTIGDNTLKLARPTGWVPATNFRGTTYNETNMYSSSPIPDPLPTGPGTELGLTMGMMAIPPPPPMSTSVADLGVNEEVCMANGFPLEMNYEDIKHIITDFGPLKDDDSFNIITVQDRKSAVFIYAHVSTVSHALQQLPLVEIQNQKNVITIRKIPPENAALLLVKVNAPGSMPASTSTSNVNANVNGGSDGSDGTAIKNDASTVICLLNMVSSEDLESNEKYVHTLLSSVSHPCHHY